MYNWHRPHGSYRVKAANQPPRSNRGQPVEAPQLAHGFGELVGKRTDELRAELTIAKTDISRLAAQVASLQAELARVSAAGIDRSGLDGVVLKH